MSRSYKHTSFCGGRNRFAKKQANRHFRRHKLESGLQHKQYRKAYCSWDIIDYFQAFESFESFYREELRNYQRYGIYGGFYGLLIRRNIDPSRKNLYRCWYKAYKMK